MIPPVLITPPAELPVTLAEAKSQCRVETDDTDEDDTITSFLGAAVAHLDGYRGVLGRCIVTQSWRQDFTDWSRCLRLPFPDVTDASVTYYGADNIEQTMAVENFELLTDARGSFLRILDSVALPALSSDRARPISASFDAGFGAASAVPEDLKTLIRQMVAHWFIYREAVVDRSMHDLPFSYDSVVSRYRRIAP